MHFKALDGWRGVCALLVATFHCRIVSHLTASRLVHGSWLFVDFFFVLSGFVIAHTYSDKIATWSDFKSFVIRRFGRLWPLHISVLAFFLLIEIALALATLHNGRLTAHAPFADDRSPFNFFITLFFLNSFGWYSGWSAPSWSIAAEFYTYIVFGAVCLIGRKPSAILYAAVAIFAAIVYSDVIGWRFFICLYEFFVGTFVYRCYTRWPAAIPEKSASIIEGIVLIAAGVFVSNPPDDIVIWLTPTIFAITVYVFAQERGVFSRLLMTTAGDRLGRWSYSIYLVHTPLMFAVLAAAQGMRLFLHTDILRTMLDEDRRPTPVIDFGNPYVMDALTIAYLLAVIAVASFSYAMVEDPARRYFNHLSGKISPAVPQAAWAGSDNDETLAG